MKAVLLGLLFAPFALAAVLAIGGAVAAAIFAADDWLGDGE